MGQKINPVSLRLQSTNRHFDNCWYSNYFYKNLINKDIFLQGYLNNFLKLIKLPTGRYSIHHLHKKTQVYNFFCYTKSTRQWRSKIFGLTKKQKFSKKNRFFLRTPKRVKKRFQKNTKFMKSFRTLNQFAVYRIQKRITSFQNYHLWSELTKTSQNEKFSNGIFTSCLLLQFNKKKNVFNYLQNPLLTINSIKQPFLIEKLHELRLKKKAKTNQQKSLSQLFSKSLDLGPVSLNSQNSYILSNDSKLPPTSDFLKFVTSTNFLFLRNLLVYKILKYQKVDLKNTNKKNKQVIFSPSNFKYKNYLESSLSSISHVGCDVIPFRVKNDWQHASYLAEELVYFLEKRIPFRRLKSKLLKQLAQIPSIRGVRITCSGRVGGKSKKAQRSKTECIKYGQTSLHVFSSKIDFSMKTAFTRFGSVGLKVWICYN